MIKGLLLTPKPLTAIMHSDIEARFVRLLSQPVMLTEKIDESLIGGIRVEVGGRVYDGSLKSQLSDILKLLQSGEEE